MSTEYDYQREIRGPNGLVYTETYRLNCDPATGRQSNVFVLFIGIQFYGCESWLFDPATGEYGRAEGVTSTMPPWWRRPSNTQALIAKYEANGKQVLKALPDAVTFCLYMHDGRMQLQQRSYVSPQGKPIGNPGKLSINGGQMKSPDINTELLREASAELGIPAVHLLDTFQAVGIVYDADMGRCNHVSRLVPSYDGLLTAWLDVWKAVRALCKPEGFGRAFVWKEDLEAAIAAGQVTPISVAILQAFPQLMPPPRPAA